MHKVTQVILRLKIQCLESSVGYNVYVVTSECIKLV